MGSVKENYIERLNAEIAECEKELPAKEAEYKAALDDMYAFSSAMVYAKNDAEYEGPRRLYDEALRRAIALGDTVKDLKSLICLRKSELRRAEECDATPAVEPSPPSESCTRTDHC